MIGTARILVNEGKHKISPIVLPDRSYDIANKGKNTGMDISPIPIQPTLKQNILQTPSAIFFCSDCIN